MGNSVNKIFSLLDLLLLPFTYFSAVLLGLIRRIGLKRMRLSRGVFRMAGTLPIRDHYYEPLFQPKHLRYSLRDDRALPGINFNAGEQLEILKRFRYNQELDTIPFDNPGKPEFYYNNGSFGPVDSQYLYSAVRLFKPGKIIEIGCGFSTLMIENALRENQREKSAYHCKHVCIEPYATDWLKKLNVELIPKRVEFVDMELFRSLDNGDILFIDSSHIIRPQGDVLFEYLEILPSLKPGVLVHIHDIFTPKDYLNEWVIEEIKLWNEQYMLEAFLSFNSRFKIIAALNYLKHNYFSEISRVCPAMRKYQYEEPCSFWIARI